MATATIRKRAPEPKGYPFVGHLPALRRDPLEFFVGARRDHGDVFRFHAGPRHPFLLAHPNAVKHVLQDNYANYHKDSAYEKTEPLLGRGLLTNEGDSWLRQRRLVQPVFHRQRLGGFAETMVASTLEMLDKRWRGYAERGEPLDVAQETMRLTLTIVGWTLFSSDVSGEAERVGRALTTALEETNTRMRSLVNLESLPLPSNRKFRAAIRTLDEVVYGMIAERRESGAEGDDLLSMLLRARDAETGESMSDKGVRDEAMTIFLAGHETTANALAWTFYLLSTHSSVLDKLLAEIDEVLAGRAPSPSDLPELRYTRMVLEESLRLYPPAWAVGRRALADDVVEGTRGRFTVPAGADVVLSPYITHRHPDFWREPERFDPERFSPQGSEGRHRFAYFPFGGGPRVCIGNSFAMMELQLVLATVLGRYRLEGLPGHPVLPQAMITLRPKHGLMMTLRPRG